MNNIEFEDQEEEEQLKNILTKERRVYTDKPDRSIYELYRQYQKGKLELQPEFQRLGEVWDNKKKSRLIESVLLEVPIPVIYLNEDSAGNYSVIDGQQRLNAFINFIENNIRLSGLTILLELNGNRFQDIPQSLQDKFENSTIRIIEIRKESQPDVKFEIFERLNTGAVQLNAQELRNCIYRGKYNNLLKELAEDKSFQFLLGLNKPHPRMQDRELILRSLAFHHKTHLKYTPSMKHFLNKEMESFRNLTASDEKDIKRVFSKSVKLTKTVFGDKAFRRFVAGSNKDPNGHWETKKINKGLFDILMFGFTLYEENQIVPCSDQIREELIWLMTHDIEFIDTITVSTDKKEKIYLRFDKWLSTLKEIAGKPLKEPRNFSLQYKKQLWESNPYCAICNQKIHIIDDAEIDHIKHYWRGGKTIPLNSRLTHRYCNRSRNYFGSSFENDNVKKSSQGTFPISKASHTKTYGGKQVKEYYVPILEALMGNGGKATQSEVFDIIEREMKDEFIDIDLETLEDGYTKRWQKKVAFAKYNMVHKEGLLKDNSPRGVWEISENGMEYLKLRASK